MFIFLDIDGVMVPAKGWASPELLNDGFPAFSSKACSTLNSLISENTTVILTSSHKSNYTVTEWKTIFRKRGVDIKNLQLLVGNMNNLTRKEEIENWFSINGTNEDFIIIDDDKSLNSLPKSLKENLVLTRPFIGLTEADLKNVKAVTDHLNSI